MGHDATDGMGMLAQAFHGEKEILGRIGNDTGSGTSRVCIVELAIVEDFFVVLPTVEAAILKCEVST